MKRVVLPLVIGLTAPIAAGTVYMLSTRAGPAHFDPQVEEQRRHQEQIDSEERLWTSCTSARVQVEYIDHGVSPSQAEYNALSEACREKWAPDIPNPFN